MHSGHLEKIAGGFKIQSLACNNMSELVSGFMFVISNQQCSLQCADYPLCLYRNFLHLHALTLLNYCVWSTNNGIATHKLTIEDWSTEVFKSRFTLTSVASVGVDTHL